MIRTRKRRRLARDGARAAAVISAGMLALCLGTVATAGAATDNGTASIVTPNRPHAPLGRGGSATPFNLKLGTNPACPGDSAGGDYRVQSFMIPSSADINAMTFDANGPVAVDGEFRQPLFDTTSSPYVNKLTDLAVPPAVTGGISGLPAFNFAVFGPGDLPAGSYRVGIACTHGAAGPTQLETFWSTTITVTASAGDQPAGITWTTATTADGATTTTVAGGAATAGGAGSGAGATTTTTADGATTTTALSSSASSTAGAFSGAGPSDPPFASIVGQMPLTGSSRWYLVAWLACLLIFGRMAYLLARRPDMPPPPDD